VVSRKSFFGAPPAAGIFPVVYHDLIRWIGERGYHAVAGPGREVWVNEIDDIADVAQQVFEIQLPFTRGAEAVPATVAFRTISPRARRPSASRSGSTGRAGSPTSSSSTRAA